MKKVKRKNKKFPSSFNFPPETNQQIDVILEKLNEKGTNICKTDLFIDLISEAYKKINTSDIDRRLKIIRLNKLVLDLDNKVNELNTLRDKYTKELLGLTND